MSLSIEKELRNLIRTGKYVIGTRQTLKLLKTGKLKLVIMAKNTPPETKARVRYYARLGNVPIIEYEGTSVDLGSALGKPFVASMIGVIDEGTSKILSLIE
ncbi:MAG: 50S ribosomal protein L30e [Desulfurococcales archaeon]|nr:50S ribosomal protein L30e [Desulfurococcales archaeon]